MSRTYLVVAIAILFGSSISCKKSPPPAPLTIEVLLYRSADIALELRRADYSFALNTPTLRSKRPVKVQMDGLDYVDFPKRLRNSAPDVLIFDSINLLPNDKSVLEQLGQSTAVCGPHPAFIPNAVTGERREAAEMYRGFMAAHCKVVVPPPAPVAESPPSAAEKEVVKDPNRPVCNSARCGKIKEFLKRHYCGESPFGNGPDDGCDIRIDRKPVTGTRVTADYVCRWNETDTTSKCEQKEKPSPEIREVLLREMRSIGLPPKAEQDVYFTVLDSKSGWSLMAAKYRLIEGLNLTIAEIILVADQSKQIHVLRKLPLRKTDADVPNVTTWSPVDIADTDGDGSVEIVLEADAYEDHWFEVIDTQDGAFQTIFSGLGYYL